jgi:hypothetical protein
VSGRNGGQFNMSDEELRHYVYGNKELDS